MSLRGKPLDQIRGSDLQSLVDNQVSERKHLEYKRSLPANSDSDKKEFLADVTSLANAAGGDLIYGVKEKDGVAVEVCGLSNINRDDEKQRLENMIRDGVEPRIPGLGIQDVELEKQGFAIIIRIPRSWASPHRVIFKGHDKFYSRNSAGKYSMDVPELRAAFLLSETTAERIRNFREGRLARIVAGETPAPLPDSPKLVLHIIPLGAFDPRTSCDVRSLVHQSTGLMPINASGCSYRHNFDGFLTHDQPLGQPFARSYVQFFRNGAVEAADISLLLRRGGLAFIPSKLYEAKLIEALSRYLSVQKLLNVEPPVVALLSLLGVRGYIMGVQPAAPWPDESGVHPIDRQDLLVPEVMIESLDCDVAEALRPAFDAVWNACGYPRSMNYDEAGK
jgi:hypothetical protein